MSRLPKAVVARVDRAKVQDYLLNPDNPENKGKAGRFAAFGFTREAWIVLAKALRDHPDTNAVTQTAPSQHGTKYVVECHMKTPDQRNPCMRTVWIIENGQTDPRLVTAY